MVGTLVRRASAGLRRAPVLGALVLAAVAMMDSSCGGVASSSTPGIAVSVPSVDRAATPPGWRAVVYGKVQVSVPPQARIIFGGCPPAPVTVFLGPGPEDRYCTLETGPTTTVSLEPLRPPLLSTTGQRPVVVHTIDVYRQFGSPSTVGYRVPALGVQVTAGGVLARKILSTITYSARAVALALGPPPGIPASWHRISSGGLSVAVPRRWSVERRSAWGTCSPDGVAAFDDTVLLVAGTSAIPLQCAHVSPVSDTQPALDAVTVDPGRYGPLSDAGSYDPCERVHGLRVCPSATEDGRRTLVLAVHLPGRKSPIAVEIGTSGDGITARRILWSMEPA